MSATSNLKALHNSQSIGSFDVPGAWASTPCPHCGGNQALCVAYVNEGGGGGTRWYRCVTCLKGAVKNDEIVSPSAKPLRTPAGLPPLDLQIWTEVRTCLGSGAYAATVMLCRKLLFHIAVAHDLPAKNDKDRSPTFYEAVEHLQEQGLVTPKMRPWVDRIKDVGNDANHELSPITLELATDVATFTEQLLVLAYELDALMAQQAGHDGP
ncbi:hypothetical protein ASE01_20015 [Nocardioides sp. Root190]|uniref:DUF4145 domain-containing protein n=1 Tax=Nocardioides sp. Root190 TaxID=1736488 RepID=UPI0006F6A203|nr:DUF4145 domain-containing protein [Nocardioides sp. Root190]KRB73064.1 hypothetical protein ASE01_20015 [Nocardioides sp. Root190]